MNFRCILMASGSHLWKRACTTVASSAPASVETSLTAPSAAASVKADKLARSDGSSEAKLVAARKEQTKKRKMLEKLRNLKLFGGTVKGTLNEFIKKEEEEGVSITQADLVRWAKRLSKDGKHKHACQIFEWMERKKMNFSPSELATYVDLIDKAKGLEAAQAYFEKVDPDFDNMDPHAKNLPAYDKLGECLAKYLRENSKTGFAIFLKI